VDRKRDAAARYCITRDGLGGDGFGPELWLPIEESRNHLKRVGLGPADWWPSPGNASLAGRLQVKKRVAPPSYGRRLQEGNAGSLQAQPCRRQVDGANSIAPAPHPLRLTARFDLVDRGMAGQGKEPTTAMGVTSLGRCSPQPHSLRLLSSSVCQVHQSADRSLRRRAV